MAATWGSRQLPELDLGTSGGEHSSLKNSGSDSFNYDKETARTPFMIGTEFSGDLLAVAFAFCDASAGCPERRRIAVIEAIQIHTAYAHLSGIPRSQAEAGMVALPRHAAELRLALDDENAARAEAAQLGASGKTCRSAAHDQDVDVDH